MKKYIVNYTGTYAQTFILYAENPTDAGDIIDDRVNRNIESDQIEFEQMDPLGIEPRINWLIVPYSVDAEYKARSLTLLRHVHEMLVENLLENTDLAAEILTFIDTQEKKYGSQES